MLKKLKKVVSTLLLSVMVLSMLGDTCAFANNWRDKSFSFAFNNKCQYVTPRSKGDSSKLYMKCNSISKNASYTAHAVGCTSKTPKKYVDCSKGKVYTFGSAGTYHYMTSWVYENGYPYASIAASPNYMYKFSADGVWSPDNKNKK